MPDQKVRQKPSGGVANDPPETAPVPQEKAQKISDDTAELLEDIDELLETLPENLAVEFKQANGE